MQHQLDQLNKPDRFANEKVYLSINIDDFSWLRLAAHPPNKDVGAVRALVYGTYPRQPAPYGLLPNMGETSGTLARTALGALLP